MGYKRLADQEKAKIVFQFSLMVVASVLAGIFLAKLASDEVLGISIDKLCIHFTKQSGAAMFFSNCLRACLSDLICLSILFVFSFSFVNYFATDLVLLFVGFKYGFGCALICLDIAAVGYLNSLSYFIVRGVAFALLLLYSCKISFYSLSLRSFSSVGRLNFDKKKLLQIVLLSLTVSGALLLLGALYSFLVFVI